MICLLVKNYNFCDVLSKNAKVIKTFGHKLFSVKILESYYDCLDLARVSASYPPYGGF